MTVCVCVCERERELRAYRMSCLKLSSYVIKLLLRMPHLTFLSRRSSYHTYNRDMRSLDKWTVIFLMPPAGGWATKGLTEGKLHGAFNESPYNTALFLDKSGNRLHQIGCAIHDHMALHAHIFCVFLCFLCLLITMLCEATPTHSRMPFFCRAPGLCWQTSRKCTVIVR